MQAFVTYTIPTVKNTAVKVRRKPFCTFMINIIFPIMWPPGGPRRYCRWLFKMFTEKYI